MYLYIFGFYSQHFLPGVLVLATVLLHKNISADSPTKDWTSWTKRRLIPRSLLEFCFQMVFCRVFVWHETCWNPVIKKKHPLLATAKRRKWRDHHWEQQQGQDQTKQRDLDIFTPVLAGVYWSLATYPMMICVPKGMLVVAAASFLVPPFDLGCNPSGRFPW